MMAATTMATTAGAVVLLYYVVTRRHWAAAEEGENPAAAKMRMRPAQAPATWMETIDTLSETLRFMYSETLGKWPIADLAFGINYLIRKQLELAHIGNSSNSLMSRVKRIFCSEANKPSAKGNKAEKLIKPLLAMAFVMLQGHIQVASVYGGNNCVQLIGPDIIAELKHYLRLLLKPAFTILRDKSSECFVLLIRGTHSIKDTLTAATGAVVPFHHSVLRNGGVTNLILGYAHCGMVAAARWIAKLSSPCLLKALDQHPHYKIKVVGHSLGGGTAAILTYILREQKEFSSSICIAFAPAACMTWELAESGKDFITTIINNSDLVPTFSSHALDDLRSEVTSSSWLNDLRDQVEHTRVLNVVYRSATAIGSRLPSLATAKATVSGAGALLRPVSSSTQVVIKRAQNVAQAVVKTRSSLSSWSCMGARRRPMGPQSSQNSYDLHDTPLITEIKSETIIAEMVIGEPCSSSGDSRLNDTDVEEEHMQIDPTNPIACRKHLADGDLWNKLERELRRSDDETYRRVQEEDAAETQIIEEQKVLVEAAECKKPFLSSDIPENHRFYPPGRIMHIVLTPISERTGLVDDSVIEEHIGIYETPRDLYSKLRLSKTMVNDHYMPMYKKMMERLVKVLENDQDCICE